MSTVNAGVTAGYTFVADGQGRVLLLKERLNLLGLPTVTVDLSGAVDTEDLVASAVSAAKLADAVADAIPVGVATVGDPVAKTNPIDVSLQISDIQGNALAVRCAVWWWLSDNAVGSALTPTSAVPDQAESYQAGNGAVAMANDTVSMSVTDATGLLTVRFQEDGGALTRYFYAIVGNKLVAGSQALVWT